MAHPEVLEVHSITGEGSHILKARTRNTNTLERFLSQVQQWPGVRATSTSIVLSTFKETRALPIEATHHARPSRPDPRARRRAAYPLRCFLCWTPCRAPHRSPFHPLTAHACYLYDAHRRLSPPSPGHAPHRLPCSTSKRSSARTPSASTR